LCAIPFHSIPFHSIPFHSIPFHSILFHWMWQINIPWQTVQFQSSNYISSTIWTYNRYANENHEIRNKCQNIDACSMQHTMILWIQIHFDFASVWLSDTLASRTLYSRLQEKRKIRVCKLIQCLFGVALYISMCRLVKTRLKKMFRLYICSLCIWIALLQFTQIEAGKIVNSNKQQSKQTKNNCFVWFDLDCFIF
jgi:hypothetical protein